MISFDSQLAALISEWLARGALPEDLAGDLGRAIYQLGENADGAAE